MGEDQGVQVQWGLWPASLAEGEPSFFNLKFSPGMSAQKRLQYRLDVLREDDRRRMDELGERLRHLREERQREAQIPGGTSGRSGACDGARSSQRRSLAWV